VKLLKVFTGPEEFTVPKSSFKSLFELITGERPQAVGLMAPAGIVSDGERYIYIADPSARLVHRIDFVDNEVTYITNSGSEPLASPVGVALDSYGNFYVTDSVKAKVYKFNKDSEYLGILGGGVVEFQRPAGIAIGRNDYKYVADVLANKINVFDNKDRFLREFPNSPEIKELNKPVNISVDPKGNVYVTDAFNFSIKMFDPAGNLVKTIGTVGDGPGTFARPKGVALDSESHIYIIDANFDNFQIFNQTGQLLLYVGTTGKRPGQFFMPNGIFIDHEDRIYVSDSYNQRLQIFQYLKEKH
jgi:sugar lactone lactonase YvrE